MAETAADEGDLAALAALRDHAIERESWLVEGREGDDVRREVRETLHELTGPSEDELIGAYADLVVARRLAASIIGSFNFTGIDAAPRAHLEALTMARQAASIEIDGRTYPFTGERLARAYRYAGVEAPEAVKEGATSAGERHAEGAYAALA